MLLTIDIGNTHIVAGVFENPGGDENLRATWRLSSHGERTADELAVFFKIAFEAEDIHFADISGVAISSVVPSLTPQAKLLATRYFHMEPLVIGHETQTGLINEYSQPHEVGADRLVNGLAAWHKHSQNGARACIIADFGTATTVDAVSHDKRYLGGAIAPGLQISTDALFRAAARLPRVELRAPQGGSTLAQSTPASMQAGLVYGYAGLVKELVSRCVEEMPARGSEKSVVIATGGLASLIAPLVPAIEIVDPDLTLDGLRLMWKRHRCG
jgi:type III pantothenate kinase